MLATFPRPVPSRLTLNWPLVKSGRRDPSWGFEVLPVQLSSIYPFPFCQPSISRQVVSHPWIWINLECYGICLHFFLVDQFWFVEGAMKLSKRVQGGTSPRAMPGVWWSPQWWHMGSKHTQTSPRFLDHTYDLSIFIIIIYYNIIYYNYWSTYLWWYNYLSLNRYQ